MDATIHGGPILLPMGVRARLTVADPKGTAYLGVGLLISSSENSVRAKF